MFQTIQNYTRIAKKGKKVTYSTIDVIITNYYSDFENSSVLPERIGDHYALKFELQYKVEMRPKYEKISMSSQVVIFTHSLRVNLFFLAIFMVLFRWECGNARY